jgi:hypothetical protein
VSAGAAALDFDSTNLDRRPDRRFDEGTVMTLSLRHILTLVALVLMNSGIGRALHTLAAHGHAGEQGAALTVLGDATIDALPEHALDDCPQCDMLRAGSNATASTGAGSLADLPPVAWLSAGEGPARVPAGADDAQPRGPPAA